MLALWRHIERAMLHGNCVLYGDCVVIIRWLRFACAMRAHIGGYIEKTVLVYMCTASAAACVHRIGRTDRVVESDFLMDFPMDFQMDFLMDFLMEKTNSRFSTFHQHVLL